MTDDYSPETAIAELELWIRKHLPANLADQVALFNAARIELHEASPFAGEPVDLVEWVEAGEVAANDYNPNAVAPPEMELLRLSVMADGFTQPIVTNREDDQRVVVDGFHRNRVGKELADVRERLHGYLPVVQIRADRVDRGDRIASTIRHNRARGKHKVEAMSDIVLELKRRNWSDKKIGTQLGMDADEVLRLTQVAGLAVAFADRDFSEAWQAEENDIESLEDAYEQVSEDA
jgi:ParB-like chromosome segregation protein Spo0J